ncbi:response regulator, partial [Myxococcota bacterium]|nr:response regulator [Myxococcota bacterium]
MTPAKRVLIVDADAAMALALEAALESAGLETAVASSGDEAEDLFAGARPAAVLLRVDLGDEDGRAVCRRLRKLPDGTLVPMLFYGHAQPTDSVRSAQDALRAGGDFFFRTPFDLADLTAQVRSWTGAGVQRADEDPLEDVLGRAGPYDARTDEATAETPLSKKRAQVSLHAQPTRIRPVADDAGRPRARSLVETTSPGFLADPRLVARGGDDDEATVD